MEKFFLETGKKEWKMGLENGNPLKAITIKANGITIGNMEKAHSSTV